MPEFPGQSLKPGALNPKTQIRAIRSQLAGHTNLRQINHSYPFDPTYGYSLSELLKLAPPVPPIDFEAFWQSKYARCRTHVASKSLAQGGYAHGFEVLELRFESTGGFAIGGWVLKPENRPIRRAFVITHGYGGRETPDFDLPVSDAAIFFPCFRGLARSRRAPLSDNPAWHVLHDIHLKEHYVIGGCVEDIWTCVSVVESLFPQTIGHIGYLGISLGGGVGALALPWEARISRAHLNVPTFGHHALRLELPTIGSAASVQSYQQRHGNALATLQYYDAATASQFMTLPVHIAAARFDPVVAPPGQFAIYNGLKHIRHLFVLDAGHYDYPGMASQHDVLRSHLESFFKDL